MTFDWAFLFKTAVGLFAIVSPIGSLPIFISATDGWESQARTKTARTVAITVFIVLLTSAFLGEQILQFFSITIASFQVGGGILLMLIAISMMHGKQSHVRQTPEEAETMAERHVIAIVPLNIPLLAGLGAISSMILTAAQTKSIWGHISLMIPIAAVSLILWLILNLAEGIANKLGVIGMNIITRLMGLVLAAMSVEFIAHGLTGLFPILASNFVS